MREKIISAVKAWKTGATLAQIRGKIDYELGSETAVRFYEALDGLVDDGTFRYDTETRTFHEEGEG